MRRSSGGVAVRITLNRLHMTGIYHWSVCSETGLIPPTHYHQVKVQGNSEIQVILKI